MKPTVILALCCLAVMVIGSSALSRQKLNYYLHHYYKANKQCRQVLTRVLRNKRGEAEFMIRTGSAMVRFGRMMAKRRYGDESDELDSDAATEVNMNKLDMDQSDVSVPEYDTMKDEERVA